ncbi:uncharacterized protein LOC115358721 [Myripristis murdjan]|uniref:uncharacterized protein LOC115358721 n=1 Tax=Myripristis murdjan TaxID=586833 RepID=UPI0011761495|nr:uncharacterized protein LOC115358721 [Myripristis murdjan]
MAVYILLFGHPLIVFFIYSFHENAVHGSQQPKLTVHPTVVTETDSVKLNCQPPSLSVTECYFSSHGQAMYTRFSCQHTVKGTELLKIAQQNSLAQVKVQCVYTVGRESLSSEPVTITIQSQKPQMNVDSNDGEFYFTCLLPGSSRSDTRCNLYFGEASHPVLSKTIWKTKSRSDNQFCMFFLKTADFIRHLHSVQRKEASCDYSLGGEPSSLYARSDGYSLTPLLEKEQIMVPTALTKSMTTGVKDVRPTASPTAYPSSAPVTPVNPGSGQTVDRPSSASQTVSAPVNPGSGLTVSRLTTTGDSTSDCGAPVTPTSGLTVGKPITESGSPSFPVTTMHTAPENQTLMFAVVVAGCGVTVGIILLVLAFFCVQRRTETCVSKRRKTKAKGDMRGTKGVVLPAGDAGVYSMITSVPESADVRGQESQNEDCDPCHVYSEICDGPAASARKDIVYSTLQAY